MITPFLKQPPYFIGFWYKAAAHHDVQDNLTPNCSIKFFYLKCIVNFKKIFPGFCLNVCILQTQRLSKRHSTHISSIKSINKIYDCNNFIYTPGNNIRRWFRCKAIDVYIPSSDLKIFSGDLWKVYKKFSFRRLTDTVWHFGKNKTATLARRWWNADFFQGNY